MAVYTTVSSEQIAPLLDQLQLGSLRSLSACQGGIENTNYFFDTDQGSYVLTLFERLNHDQLPFYLELMLYLSKAGIPAPQPVANLSGTILHTLNDKPACVVNKLPGHNDGVVTQNRCEKVGAVLAKMHLKGQDFSLEQDNLRSLAWWNTTIPKVIPFLTPEQARLIQSELSYQNHIAQQSAYAALPRGPIHADLFRDNVMFDSINGRDELTGVFDFYFAGIDSWLFDIAVCLNDWCVDPNTGQPQYDLQQAFLASYESVRALTKDERALFHAMLRAAALRFWTSRLWDFYLPRTASLLKAHDPSHFERILLARLHFDRSMPHET